MTQLDARAADVLANYRDDLLSGKVYRNHARSAASVMGYQPPIDARSVVRVQNAIWQWARDNRDFNQDQSVAIASRLSDAVYPYQTRHEIYARLASALAELVAKPWDDVIGRASPDPGRYSDHQHPWTLRQTAVLAVLLNLLGATLGRADNHSIGWCLAAVCQAEAVQYESEVPR